VFVWWLLDEVTACASRPGDISDLGAEAFFHVSLQVSSPTTLIPVLHYLVYHFGWSSVPAQEILIYCVVARLHRILITV
jgi:hypothetical protein